jgi:hypothetical protein
MIIASGLFYQQAFFFFSAALCVWIACWISTLGIALAVAFVRMRRDVEIDWHAKLQELLSQQQQQCPEEASDIMHLAFIPNYNEDEDMLFRTLENLARSTIARESLHVVLAMEEREGAEVREKADRLMKKSAHFFADISATFHPANLPGDIAGKSSNNQWAYRQTMQKYANKLSKMDASKVFITCFDADTLIHPQYLTSLTYKALLLPSEERAWTLWQPPVLLLRNLFSSPSPTRLSGYATILFELGGLANQHLSPHFTFSTYSFTLALSSHYMVDGWDRDVIAEDHHMFCKCYFASIWEQLHALEAPSSSNQVEAVASELKLQPVYLPALAYLVESDNGWFASVYARFVQARRHSQGVAELSYVVLQHAHLSLSEQAGHIAWSTHRRILGMAGKMATVHIALNLQCLANLIAWALLVPSFVSWLLHNLDVVSTAYSELGLQGLLNLSDLYLGGMRLVYGMMFCPMGIMTTVIPLITYSVVLDTLEGKFTTDFPRQHDSQKDSNTPSELAAPDVQGSAKGWHGMAWMSRLRLFIMVQNDYVVGGPTTLLIYGLFPAMMASWSLLGKGDRGFQYIVGEKPTEH